MLGHPTTRAVLLALATSMALAACSKKEEAPPAQAPVAAPAAAPASEPGLRTENVYSFKIGDFSAMALLDGNLELPNDNKVFGVGLKPEDVAAVLKENGLPTDKLQLSIHPLLVQTGDRVLLFDTGAGGNFGPGSGHLPAALAEAKVDPASVTDIFISHSHGDHVGGLASADGKLAFPNATIHISSAEWSYMSGLDQYKPVVPVIQPKVQAFEPDAELVPGVVKAVDIKGHTPGHSGYRITSGSASLLYVGDSMHHFVVSVQRPQWTIAFDGDNTVATASRVALIKELAGSGERVFAVHFPFPGLGKMEQRGEGAAWTPE
ncbi:MAG TPA: MBL fold metallo-hydrolase [Steroidobacteraceae bacterium]|jgi:glyoxylase-like metal-dependent hydrolase (beta-lactamase superfamily II)|nr:MBL fold metallo-hydrolase [Steroidobacteraceae bacterium]